MSLTPNEKDLLAKKSDLEGILKPDANDILHLPDITISLAENQQGYTTSGLSKDGLVFAGAGTITGITSSEGVSTTLAASQSMASAKQDKLIAGSNITIAQDGKTISATDTNELENLTDVNITTPTDGQGLVYNNTTQKWENGTVSSASSIDTLTDVNLTNLTNGQILKYNSTSQEWENANESGEGGSSALSDLTDVTVTSPSDGQVLTYDNTSGKWVNDTPTAASSISTLTDVNLTSLSDGQILKYDATNDEWVNADESGGGGGTSKYTEEVLWSGNESTSRWVEPIVLNIDITDYDMLSIRCGPSNETGGVHIILTSEIPSGSSSGDGTVSLGTFTDSQYSIWLNKDDNILRIFTSTGVSINVKEVVGIKYGSGGGGASELDDLQDVTLINPTTGQALVFDGTKWVNADVAGTQEQADWNQTDTTAVDYIKNKPTIPPTLSASGNIEIDSNVIKRKEVWLNSVAEYEALANPDSNTDYHVPSVTFGLLPITVVNGKICCHYKKEV